MYIGTSVAISRVLGKFGAHRCP